MIKQKIKEINEIRKQLPRQAEIIAKKSKEAILDYIREKQLFEKGIDGYGNKLKEYSPFTIAVKRSKGQKTDVTTLNDTSGLYDKMDLIFTDQHSIGVFSRDVKTPDIIEKYGEGIFVFTVENIEEINNNIFRKQLLQWILKTKTFTQI